MRGLFSVAVIPDAPVESAAPIVAAVGEWSTPKRSGSLPTASAVANAQSGRWERLERLNEREAGCAVVRHYVMREPLLCQHYTGRHHAQAEALHATPPLSRQRDVSNQTSTKIANTTQESQVEKGLARVRRP